MIIKKFKFYDISTGFHKDFVKGLIIESTKEKNIIHNYTDEETDVVVTILKNSCKILKEDISTLVNVDEDVSSSTSRFEIVDYFNNTKEKGKCIFFSTDDYEKEGLSVVYFNINQHEGRKILEHLQEINKKIDKCIISKKINSFIKSLKSF